MFTHIPSYQSFRLIFLLLGFLLALANVHCSKKAPSEPEEEPSIFKWTYNDVQALNTMPAIGKDGSVYYSGKNAKTNKVALFAFTADGKLKWKFERDSALPMTSPVVGSDGTIYVGHSNSLFALNPTSGEVIFEYQAAKEISTAFLALSMNNDIYFGAGDALYAVSPSGDLKWRFVNPDLRFFNLSPVVGSDGTIFAGDMDKRAYTNGGIIYAVTPDGQLKWKNNMLNKISSQLTVGPGDTLFVGIYDNGLYALVPTNGGMFEIDEYMFAGGGDEERQSHSPVIGNQRYVLGSGLRAVSFPGGKLQWSLPIRYVRDVLIGETNAFVLGTEEGTVLFAEKGGVYDGLFREEADNKDFQPLSLLNLSADGTLYFCRGNTFYAYPADFSLLKNAVWPKMCHDSRNTSNINTAIY
ncbi:MAG: PQQ-like beta-propeller repeat protein [Calditrichaeota bacterium]|nr:PQQ-like beta-propeller repeat protein [Calditrichota bacterium]